MTSVDVSALVSRLRTLGRTRSQESRWLVVPDVNVYVRAITGHRDGPNRKIIEAATAGILTLVMSTQIRSETIEVLTREDVGGYDADLAADLMEPVCSVARFVEPTPDDPKYRAVVHDPDDVIILRTAAGIYFENDLASATQRYIVSGDTHAFPPGRDWYGFKYRAAGHFWQELCGDAESDA